MVNIPAYQLSAPLSADMMARIPVPMNDYAPSKRDMSKRGKKAARAAIKKAKNNKSMMQTTAKDIAAGTVAVVDAEKHATYWRIIFHNVTHKMGPWLRSIDA